MKDVQEEIPTNVIAEILRDYTDRLDQIKNSLLLFLVCFCFFAVQSEDVELIPQEEIADAPAPKPMSEEALNYLLSEDIYQGTLSWQGNKASTKFNYDMKKENK